MSLTLILGPMKSGKSYDLISYFAPLKYTEISHALFQPVKNVRDEHIQSRNGSLISAQKIERLADLQKTDADVIGIDEFHMFGEEGMEVVDDLLRRGKQVIVSSLDTDYRGRLFANVVYLFSLGPKEVRFRRAVCELCKTPDAVYTQVFHGEEPVLGGMPASIPDDGTFRYVPMCRRCFVKGV